MKEQWAKIKEWWGSLALREKQAVFIGGAALSLFIFYVGFWSPFLNHIAGLRKRIQTEEATLVWMIEADKEIQKIATQNKKNNQLVSPVLLLGFLQKQLDEFKLTPTLTQLKQATNDTVEMHFQKVQFDKLIALLTTVVKQQAVAIVQMSAISESTTGEVNADLVLKIE